MIPSVYIIDEVVSNQCGGGDIHNERKGGLAELKLKKIKRDYSVEK